MAKLTKALRTKIVLDFVANNDGVFDPAAFVEHIRNAGPEHPAYAWFEWSDEKAAQDHRVSQARQFLHGLVVKFEVQSVVGGAMKIAHREMPLLISPREGRSNGGGYVPTEPSDPAHVAEFCRQAAETLRWFVARYAAAIAHVGGDVAVIDDLRGALDAATDEPVSIAAE